MVELMASPIASEVASGEAYLMYKINVKKKIIIMKVSLSSYYAIRNDRQCSYIVRRDNLVEDTGGDSSVICIPPFMGFIFSELGKEDYANDLKRISEITGMNISSIKSFTDQLINNEKHKEFVLSENLSIVFPKNILVKDGDYEQNRYYTVQDFSWDDDFHVARPSMPLSVNLMTTTKCTTNCRYCYAKRDLFPLLNVEELANLVEELHSNGVFNISLTGGDIFALENWHILLKKIKEYDYHPFLSTKTPLKNDDIKLLSTIGVKALQFSLDSNDPVVLHELLGTSKEYIKNVETMFRLCDESDIILHIRSVLTSLNGSIQQVKSFYDFLSSFNCIKGWTITPAFFSEYKQSEYKDLLVKNKELVEVYEFVKQSGHSFPIGLNKINKDGYQLHRYDSVEDYVAKNQICMGNTTSLSILANGVCSVCEMLYDHDEYILGDVRLASVKEIWNSKKALELYYMKQSVCSKKSPCSTCSEFQNCRSSYGKRVCYSDIAKTGLQKDYPDPRCPMSRGIDLLL